MRDTMNRMDEVEPKRSFYMSKVPNRPGRFKILDVTDEGDYFGINLKNGYYMSYLKSHSFGDITFTDNQQKPMSINSIFAYLDARRNNS